MQNGGKLDSLKSFIKVAIKLDDKLYKLVLKIRYSNLDSKTRSYLKHTSYCKGPIYNLAIVTKLYQRN